MSLAQLRADFERGILPKPAYIAAMLEQHRQLFAYAEHLTGTDIQRIEITEHGPVFWLRDMPCRLTCPVGEARVAPLEILNFRHYEAHEIGLLRSLLGKQTCALDIGANIGWFALWLAHHLPQATVHAFEPIPQSYQYLSRNIAANGVGARVLTYNHGLSNEAGIVDFHVHPTGSTNASMLNVSGAADARRVRAMTLTVDEWCINHEASPDFIKCDVEGAEFLVFRGAQQTLKRCQPLVFTEMLRKWSQPFGYHPNDVLVYFRELGYRCLALSAQGLKPFEAMDDQTVETNFLFLHRERHADLLARAGVNA